jgi:RNA polymerase sigma-70 factor (ECF subfamily)
MIEDLIEQCRQNNRKAQDKLYHLNYGMMKRTARKALQQEHDIVSVINDGFLKACKNIRLYSSDLGPFEAWLHTIITHTARDHLRKQRTNPSYTPVDEEIEIADNAHLQVIKPEYLHRPITEFPPVTRSVLSLNIEGFSHREISGMLQISELSSRWHLSEAKKKLKARLHLATSKSTGV